ncbi:PHP domain-containing protein [bacterium]|nr:PHP domain-containing protein [bacterium]
MNTAWRVDLHNHTLWSKDCLVRFETIIKLCARRHIDRIAITDHNTAEGALQMHAMAPQLVIPGEEVMTTQGELLAYYVKETVPAGLSPEEAIARLREQGAVISVSHPFDRLRKGAWREEDLLRISPLVDAVEVFNARCLFASDNEKARAFAARHGKLGTAGSDSHTPTEYGTGLALLPPFDNTAAGLLQALQAARYEERLSEWWVHTGSMTAKWQRKLGLRRRLWDGG